MMNYLKNFFKSLKGLLIGATIGLILSLLILSFFPPDSFGTQGMQLVSLIIKIGLTCVGGCIGYSRAGECET